MDYAWNNLANYVLSMPAHYDVAVPKDIYVHPLQAGFGPRLGEPKGQIADYGLTVSDGRGIHVLEFQDRYLIHWDIRDPVADPLGHIAQDAPQYGPVLGALAFAGLLFGLAWLDSQR